jgi:hypothetical protein
MVWGSPFTAIASNQMELGDDTCARLVWENKQLACARGEAELRCRLRARQVLDRTAGAWTVQKGRHGAPARARVLRVVGRYRGVTGASVSQSIRQCRSGRHRQVQKSRSGEIKKKKSRSGGPRGSSGSHGLWAQGKQFYFYMFNIRIVIPSCLVLPSCI